MHQTCKGKQYYFGMKMHIGVDSQSGLAHSAVVTAANVHDKHPLPDLLHGREQQVWATAPTPRSTSSFARRLRRHLTAPIAECDLAVRLKKSNG
jgi:IS5 family transposase